MAFKVSSQHWELLVEFMELHPDFARGRIIGPSGRETFKRLWSELTLQLNALGIGERTIQKWQKTWTDFKYALKKKASEAKLDIEGTGGGPPKIGSLTDLEIRILNILGKTFYDGLGIEETGVGFLKTVVAKENKVETPKVTLSKTKTSVLVEAGTSTNVQNIVTPPIPTSTQSKSTPKKRQLIDDDHDYSTKASSVVLKKIKENEMEILYRETLSELREIGTSLKEIKQSIGGIESGVNRLADAIINIRK